ncbi:hypothetical protein [Terriglobus aquaticus]|uniref:PhiE125 gp8 family phage protein n=1 Tax=Terriglobus aquaticus TaxID=940139 RepID=A0ABW9KFP7_9BACT|nr:hypothetical protein [Terriglobus aquaticus]
MVYLQPGDYALNGLDDETPDALVAAASALIDAFCRRASLGVISYVERLRFARDGRTLRLSYGPVVAITACRTRLRRMRPDRWSAMPFTQLQADAMAFGLGGTWNTIDPTTLSISVDGEAELPTNLLGVPADEAEITYTAGYATIPAPVQMACAQIVRNAQSTPGLNVKRQHVDALEMDYFSNTLLDADVQRLLQPYCATRLG